MFKAARALCALGFFFVLLASPYRTDATTIQFTVIDVNDALGPGGDLWEYRYRISGFSFLTNDDVNIFFDSHLYSDLDNPPPAVNADWDVITLPPDPTLTADGVDGVYDALALADHASLMDSFTVRFVWLGVSGTVPGAQAFVIKSLDAGGMFQDVDSGQTTPAATVPEPSTLGLLGIGLVSLLGWCCRRRHIRMATARP